MYEVKERVSFSRMDANGLLGISNVIDSMQDACMFHSQDVGHPPMEMLEKNRAWLVSAWDVVFCRRPKLGECFVTKTWPHSFKGVIGCRNFEMQSEEGEVLTYAESQWFYADPTTGKPVRIDKEELEVYPLEEAYDMEYKSRKVSVPEDILTLEQTISVSEGYLDTNGHVNNGQYVRLAANVISPNLNVKELRAEYRNAAHAGDTFYLYRGEQDDKIYIVLADDNKTPYFLSEFTIEK